MGLGRTEREGGQEGEECGGGAMADQEEAEIERDDQ